MFKLKGVQLNKFDRIHEMKPESHVVELCVLWEVSIGEVCMFQARETGQVAVHPRLPDCPIEALERCPTEWVLLILNLCQSSSHFYTNFG